MHPEEGWKAMAALSRGESFESEKSIAVGRVSRKKVSLRRAIPGFGNSFQPLFTGRFHERNGRVVLSGRFAMRLFTRVFMTYWFGFCVVWTVLAIFAVVSTHDFRFTFFPLGGLGMFAGGVFFVSRARRVSEGDVPWLSNVIRLALSGTPVEHRPQPIE